MRTLPLPVPPRHARRWWTVVRFTLALATAIAIAHGTRAVGPTLVAGWTGVHSSDVVHPASIDLVDRLTDSRPIAVRITENWVKVVHLATVDAVRHDRSLWRRMHFDDWDTLPAALRVEGLRRLLRGYGHVLGEPSAWRYMTVAEWDLVPQPIRALAYLRMVRFWASREAVAAEFGLSPRTVEETIGAIVMAESWFEHRAVNENQWGNRDLGLAQCSTYCRTEIAIMAKRGELDFAPPDADYFNPFVATRVATVWFQRELRHAEGDIELAIRAYHRGMENALDERGDAYLARVLATRARYMRNGERSSSWTYLMSASGTRPMQGGAGPSNAE